MHVYMHKNMFACIHICTQGIYNHTLRLIHAHTGRHTRTGKQTHTRANLMPASCPSVRNCVILVRKTLFCFLVETFFPRLEGMLLNFTFDCVCSSKPSPSAPCFPMTTLDPNSFCDQLWSECTHVSSKCVYFVGVGVWEYACVCLSGCVAKETLIYPLTCIHKGIPCLCIYICI